MSVQAAAGRLAGRIALVTGASRGIGRAVALRYAREGATVVAFARTKKALESLDDEIRAATGANAVLVAESLTDYAKIDATAAAIAQRYGRLDILVGNAGVLGQLSPMGDYTPKQWDDVIAANLTANWRLIRACDRLLRAAPAGRAMFVTSGAARSNAPYWGPYAVSKAALERMVQIYAAEVAFTKVRANIIDPGAVRTEMRAKAKPGENPLTLPTPEAITEVFVELAEPAWDRTGEIVRARTA
ncbi:MAG: SDR family NAD(P)-dependent oxidoreductase [Rhodospirillaceae bacterium]|nr:SDR family NAD(P)-dependent oxidoreductase [Rhodospirillaceae bacterium]